jgi:hypothetical protein
VAALVVAGAAVEQADEADAGHDARQPSQRAGVCEGAAGRRADGGRAMVSSVIGAVVVVVVSHGRSLVQSGIGDVTPAYAALSATSRAGRAARLLLRGALALGLLLRSPASAALPPAPGPRAPAPTTALAARFSLRLPLADTADPLPWPIDDPNPARGGSRLDLQGGLALALDRPVELSLDLRWSPYGLLLADEQVVFAQRVVTELGGVVFVGEHVERGASGLWSGGFVDLRVGGELRGRRQPGDAPLLPGTAQAALGYRKELSPGVAASLSLGGGAVLDPGRMSGGVIVLVTVLSERALW